MTQFPGKAALRVATIALGAAAALLAVVGVAQFIGSDRDNSQPARPSSTAVGTLLTNAVDPYGRTLPNGDGGPIAMQSLLPVCTDGGPVTIADVRGISGDLQIVDWTVLTPKDADGFDGRSFASSRPPRNLIVSARCDAQEGDAVPEDQGFDNILIELRRPADRDARLDGVEVTYDTGSDSSAVRFPLSAVLCSDDAPTMPECVDLSGD